MAQPNEIVIFEDPEKGAGFAQMCHLLTCDNTISHGAYRTYAALSIFAMQSNQCNASVERLAAILDCSRQMVSDYLKELQGRGLIRRERQKFGKTMVTTICNLNRVYQDDPILNRFIELSGRFNGQLGFTTGDDTVVKQALPQSSSELDDSSKADLTTDVKQTLPEEEESNNSKKEEKEAANAALPPAQNLTMPGKKQKVPKDPLTHAFQFANGQATDEALADAHIPSPEYSELTRIHAQALGIPPPQGKEGQEWDRLYQEIVKKVGDAWGLENPGEAFALTKKALERLAAMRGTRDGRFWWGKHGKPAVWSSPRADSLREKLIEQAGRLIVQRQPVEPWNSRTTDERPTTMVAREPKTEEQKTWEEILALLRLQMAQGTFNSLLKGSRCVGRENGRFIVEVRSTYAKDWLENRLAVTIERAMASVTDLGLEFRVKESEEEAEDT